MNRNNFLENFTGITSKIPNECIERANSQEFMIEK